MLQGAISQPTAQTKKTNKREEYESYIATLLPKLNSLATGFTRPDNDLAKDLVQEAVIKGYQSYMNGGLVLDDRAKAWFATVIRNEFLMVRRKNKRLIGELDDEFIGTDGRKDFENVGLRDVLNQAIAELPDDQRECILLIDLHQFDYDEAAKILQVPVGTIRSRLSRARMKLATRLHAFNPNATKSGACSL
jgi:RNA polymerase sigma-70 factor (ECF subfamily)